MDPVNAYDYNLFLYNFYCLLRLVSNPQLYWKFLLYSTSLGIFRVVAHNNVTEKIYFARK